MTRRRPRRSLDPAVRGIVLTAVALVLAALLNAHGIRKNAETQQPGFRRDAALALARPLVRVSDALYLDRPRHALQTAIGRSDEDRIDTNISLALPPPPAGPRAKKTRAAAKQPPLRRRERSHAPPKQKFAPARPLRVWVAGDSLVEVPGQALQRAVGSRGAIRVLSVESRLSTGLGRPDLYNWFTRIRDVMRNEHPKVAVLSFGADDAHDYLAGVPTGRTIGGIGSPTWNAEYRRRVEGVTRELNAAGIYVVWIGLPLTRSGGYRWSFPIVNRILRSVALAHRDGATYVDVWHMLLNKRGKYSDYLPDARGRLVPMRAADGIHYLPPAGDLIARAVLRRLNEQYDLTSWRRA